METLKVHVALNVDKFEESVNFYRAMFGVDPVKWKPGYVKFDIAEPALNLTLNEGAVSDRGALNHLGIQVPTTAHVLQARERLQKAQLMTLDEMNVNCYALQDKIWVTDPNGYRWEIFTVKVGDTQPELNISAESLGTAQQNASCCRQ